jgi:hypothetical protein
MAKHSFTSVEPMPARALPVFGRLAGTAGVAADPAREVDASSSGRLRCAAKAARS